MDFQAGHRRDRSSPGAGGDRLRLTAKVGGHTYIYEYPPDETERVIDVIKEHVADGKLHPYAGLVLVTLGREFDESGD
jgi:hypothetical protein